MPALGMGRRLLAGAGQALVLLPLLVLAAYHLGQTLGTLGYFGLRHPFLDQFRLIHVYLSQPFWPGVLALENGHRPVFPGMVRWADLAWFDGRPLLQALSAWAAAALALGLLLRACWRDLRGWRAVAAACALVITLLWNSHARMFIHPHEAQHLWYIFLGLVLACVAAWCDRPRWGLAWLACVFATFSFGPGLATFVALLGLALLSRPGLRVWVALIAGLAAVAWLYLMVLPGAGGVRGQGQDLHLHLPAAVFYVGVRWGAWWAELLRLQGWGGARVAGLAWILGVGVAVLMAVSVLGRWWRREHLCTTEACAVGLALFGLTANAMIVLNRIPYFAEHPGQLFAERYLFWSAVWWAGAALYALARCPARLGTGPVLACVGVLLLAIAAIAPAKEWRGWAAEVTRLVERSHLAARLDWRVAEDFEAITDGPVTNAWRALDDLRRHGSGGLGGDADWGRRIGQQLPTGNRPTWVIAAQPRTLREPPTDASGQPLDGVRALAAVLPEALATEAPTHYWLLTPEGRIVGAAGTTFALKPRTGLWGLGRPPLRGLDGYVRGGGAELWLLPQGSSQAVAVLRL